MFGSVHFECGCGAELVGSLINRVFRAYFQGGVGKGDGGGRL